MPVQWRQNGRNDVSNHRNLDCLLNLLFRRRSKKTSKLHVTGLCDGNSPVTGEVPAQRPITRKMFLLDDVIMLCLQQATQCWLHDYTHFLQNWFCHGWFLMALYRSVTILNHDRWDPGRYHRTFWVNSLAPGSYRCNIKLIILKPISRINIFSIQCDTIIRWMP